MIKFIIKLAPAIGLELLSTRLRLKKELAVLKTTRRQSIPPGVLKDLVDESAKNHEDNMKALQDKTRFADDVQGYQLVSAPAAPPA
eukprot:423353-Pyramimonas_sp.AAC.1